MTAIANIHLVLEQAEDAVATYRTALTSRTSTMADLETRCQQAINLIGEVQVSGLPGIDLLATVITDLRQSLRCHHAGAGLAAVDLADVAITKFQLAETSILEGLTQSARKTSYSESQKQQDYLTRAAHVVGKLFTEELPQLREALLEQDQDAYNDWVDDWFKRWEKVHNKDGFSQFRQQKTIITILADLRYLRSRSVTEDDAIRRALDGLIERNSRLVADTFDTRSGSGSPTPAQGQLVHRSTQIYKFAPLETQTFLEVVGKITTADAPQKAKELSNRNGSTYYWTRGLTGEPVYFFQGREIKQAQARLIEERLRAGDTAREAQKQLRQLVSGEAQAFLPVLDDFQANLNSPRRFEALYRTWLTRWNTLATNRLFARSVYERPVEGIQETLAYLRDYRNKPDKAQMALNDLKRRTQSLIKVTE